MANRIATCPVCKEPLNRLLFDGSFKCGKGHIIARKQEDASAFLLTGTNEYLEESKRKKSRIDKGTKLADLYPPKQKVNPPMLPKECEIIELDFHLDGALKKARELLKVDPGGHYGYMLDPTTGNWATIKCQSMPINGRKTDDGLVYLIPLEELEEEQNQGKTLDGN